MIEGGSIIQDRYRIVKPLGEGGMGAVYRAWDLRLNVPVALKELRPQPGLDEEMLLGLRQQFQQEASILARLSHPNLVRVTDYFEESGKVFLIMDFIAGDNLAKVIEKEGALSEQRVLGWTYQLLAALTYCHSQGVIHRDIKPQNIIIKDDGNITLVDFGLVKLWDPSDPRTKTVMRGLGTPEYAPPEQYGASTDHTGPPSDLYSLGATLYHALTGQSPPTATERMAIPDEFIPLRRLAPNVSPRTDAVVMKALELSVPKRWRTAAEMEAGLRGSGDLQNTVSPMPSPFVESSNYIPPIPTQRVGTAVPTTPSSIPVMPAVVPSVSRQARATRKKWPVALGVVGGLLCVIAVCVGGIVGLPFLEEMFATTPPPPTTIIAQPPTKTSTPATDVITGDFSLTIVNQSPFDVCYIYISAADSDTWGDDWLEDEQVIAPGQSQIFDVPEGNYDFLAETCNEATLSTGWDLKADVTYYIGGTGLIPIWVHNTLDVEICYLFISPVDSDDWGQDLLGEVESIPAYGSRIVFVSPDIYDFSALNCEEDELGYQYDTTVNEEMDWYIE